MNRVKRKYKLNNRERSFIIKNKTLAGVRNKKLILALYEILSFMNNYNSNYFNRICVELFFIQLSKNMLGGCLPLNGFAVPKKAIITIIWDEIKSKSMSDIRYIIFHEIAHFLCGHSSLPIKKANDKITNKKEMNNFIRVKENEADELTDKLLDEFYNPFISTMSEKEALSIQKKYRESLLLKGKK